MKHLTVLFVLLYAAVSISAETRYRFEAEMAPVYVEHQRIYTPGAASEYADIKALDKNGTYTGRIELSADFDQTHLVSYTFSPLQFNDWVGLTEPYDFNGVTFIPGEDVRTRLYFFEHRIRYRYAFPIFGKFSYQIGASLNIEDFEINVLQSDRGTTIDEVAVNPQLFLRAAYQFNPQWAFITQADFQSWIDEYYLSWYSAVRWKFARQWDGSIGYRLLQRDREVDEYRHDFSFSYAGTFSVAYVW